MWEFFTGIFQALVRADWAYRRALQTLNWLRQMLLAAGLALCYLAMNIQLQAGAFPRVSKGASGFSVGLVLNVVASMFLLVLALRRLRPNMGLAMARHIQYQNAAIGFVVWVSIIILTIAFSDSHIEGPQAIALYVILVGPAWVYFGVTGYLILRAAWRYWRYWSR